MAVLNYFSVHKLVFGLFLKLQKIDLFDFTSFLSLNFFKFFGQLRTHKNINSDFIVPIGSNHLEQYSTFITNPTNLVDSISASNDITENVNILKKRKSANEDLNDKESNYQNEDVKKAKLEPKSSKKRPSGYEEERYNETSYYIEDNLRKVVPYYFGKNIF